MAALVADGEARAVAAGSSSTRGRSPARSGSSSSDAATGGASDANTTSGMGVPTLDGLGPIGGNDHSPAEYLEVASIVPRTTLLAGAAARDRRDPEVARLARRRPARVTRPPADLVGRAVRGDRRLQPGGRRRRRAAGSRARRTPGRTASRAIPATPRGQARAALEIIEPALGEAGFAPRGRRPDPDVRHRHRRRAAPSWPSTARCSATIRPASTLVEVVGADRADLLVEIEAEARRG